jgi:purine-binding chemotaxis protein CheW
MEVYNMAISNIIDSDIQSEDTIEVAIFKLQDEFYCIEVEKVSEIIEMSYITFVPNVSDYVEGVINLRGKIIPIVNLRKKLDMEEKEFDKKTRIIILDIGDMNVGMIVDSVFVIDIIKKENLEKTSNIEVKEGMYLKNFALTKVGFIGILDIEKLLQ